MKRKLVILIIIITFAILLSTNSYGALTSKPKTAQSEVLVGTTTSNSYLLCQQMTRSGESLYGATVKPHLSTNKDWGAVSYLSNSIYGTNTKGQNTGVQIEINGVNYYSTTGNASGVMDWGRLVTQTAGLIDNYDPETSTASANVTELYNNRNTEYVDYINPKNKSLTLGMAMQETNGKYSTSYYNDSNNNYPTSIRKGLFGYAFTTSIYGYEYYEARSNGAAYSTRGATTFRPVIWN